MGKGFKHGAGGAKPLNFKIVGGTAQPSSPKENMIWVTTGITLNGWVFSPTEPEEYYHGLYWFVTGTEGTESTVSLNALKKNGIVLSPLKVMVYNETDGAWQVKVARCYQNGTWVTIEEAALYFSLTSPYWSSKSTSGNGGSITVNDGKIVASLNENTGYGAGIDVYCSEQLDMTKYTTLEFEVELDQEFDSMNLFIDSGTNGTGSVLAQIRYESVAAGRKVYTLDISGVASGYLRFQIYRRSGYGTATVSMVRLKG